MVLPFAWQDLRYLFFKESSMKKFLLNFLIDKAFSLWNESMGGRCA